MCNPDDVPDVDQEKPAVRATRERILDVAAEVLGVDPDAGMGEVATAAGVVRRTVYGHFPSRADLVLALTRRAADELTAAVAEGSGDPGADEAWADEVWAGFVGRLWPLLHRYRVLVVLRRGELGPDIHAVLAPVDAALAGLVRRGQEDGVFGRHLPAEVLSQVAWSSVFTVADGDLAHGGIDAGAAVTTSLLALGVPASRAAVLAARSDGLGARA